MNEVCDCWSNWLRSSTGAVSTYALAMPMISPVPLTPISSTSTNSIRIVVMSTLSRKLGSRVRGLNNVKCLFVDFRLIYTSWGNSAKARICGAQGA